MDGKQTGWRVDAGIFLTNINKSFVHSMDRTSQAPKKGGSKRVRYSPKARRVFSRWENNFWRLKDLFLLDVKDSARLFGISVEELDGLGAWRRHERTNIERFPAYILEKTERALRTTFVTDREVRAWFLTKRTTGPYAGHSPVDILLGNSPLRYSLVFSLASDDAYKCRTSDGSIPEHPSSYRVFGWESLREAAEYAGLSADEVRLIWRIRSAEWSKAEYEKLLPDRADLYHGRAPMVAVPLFLLYEYFGGDARILKSWIREKNTGAPFFGRSPLAFMIDADHHALSRLALTIDAWERALKRFVERDHALN